MINGCEAYGVTEVTGLDFDCTSQQQTFVVPSVANLKLGPG